MWIHVHVGQNTCVSMWGPEVETRFYLMTLHCLFQDRFLTQPRAQLLAGLAGQWALRSFSVSFISVVQVWSVCLAFTWVLGLNSGPRGCMVDTLLNRPPTQPHKSVWCVGKKTISFERKKDKPSSSVGFLLCGLAVSLHRGNCYNRHLLWSLKTWQSS